MCLELAAKSPDLKEKAAILKGSYWTLGRATPEANRSSRTFDHDFSTKVGQIIFRPGVDLLADRTL